MREIFDNLSTVFSNSTRLQIMHFLNEEPLTITELTAKIPNASASVVSRHLSILDEQGFIIKKAATGRSYELSPFGESICCMMKPITFFLKFETYFKSHSLTSLPANFLCSINMLEGAKFVEGTGSVMNELNSFIKSIKQKFYFLSNTHILIPHYNFEEIRVVYPENLFEKIGVAKLREDIKEYTNLSVDEVSLRLLPEIDIGLAIADDGEKGVVVCPRNDETTLDYAGMFIIDDEIGME
ncbi:MAG: ArsR family transcriptional regulator, partial [Candidatus Odinarchaeota archaeon]